MENLDSYLFILKKFLGGLLMPVPMALLLLFWAVLFLLRRKTRWFGVLLTTVVTVFLFVASYPPLTAKIIAPLEQQYPSYQSAAEPADYIAVLGAAHVSAADQPITSQLSPTGIVRISEGIRIYRLNPGSKLIFTGANFKEPDSYADKSKELALALGVPETDILAFTGPQDTAEEAQLIAENFPASKLVLVTSAAHMPRAMFLFQRVGLTPVPAPTHHQNKPVRDKLIFPTAQNLTKVQYWMHEQLGLLWAKLTDRPKPANR